MSSVVRAAMPRFEVTQAAEGNTIIATLRGTADMDAIDALEGFITNLHVGAIAARAARVEVDFRSLEFMSSSCFKCFVSWIGLVQEMPRETQYAVTLRSNPKFHWQRRSLNALRCFALDLVTVAT